MCVHIVARLSCSHTRLIPQACDGAPNPLLLELCETYRLLPLASSRKCSDSGAYCKETPYGRYLENMKDLLNKYELEEYLADPCFEFTTFNAWVIGSSVVRQMRVGKGDTCHLPVHSLEQSRIIDKARQTLLHMQAATRRKNAEDALAVQRVHSTFNVPPAAAQSNTPYAAYIAQSSLLGREILSAPQASQSAGPPSPHVPAASSQAPPLIQYTQNWNSLPVTTASQQSAVALAFEDIARNSPLAAAAKPRRHRSKKQPRARPLAPSPLQGHPRRTCVQKPINYAENSNSEDSSADNPLIVPEPSTAQGAIASTPQDPAIEFAIIDHNIGQRGEKRVRTPEPEHDVGVAAQGIESPVTDGKAVSVPAANYVDEPATKRARLSEESPCERFSAPATSITTPLRQTPTITATPGSALSVSLQDHVERQVILSAQKGVGSFEQPCSREQPPDSHAHHVVRDLTTGLFDLDTQRYLDEHYGTSMQHVYPSSYLTWAPGIDNGAMPTPALPCNTNTFLAGIDESAPSDPVAPRKDSAVDLVAESGTMTIPSLMSISLLAGVGPEQFFMPAQHRHPTQYLAGDMQETPSSMFMPMAMSAWTPPDNGLSMMLGRQQAGPYQQDTTFSIVPTIEDHSPLSMGSTDMSHFLSSDTAF